MEVAFIAGLFDMLEGNYCSFYTNNKVKLHIVLHMPRV